MQKCILEYTMRKRWTGTGAIQGKILLSKSKWEIIKITNRKKNNENKRPAELTAISHRVVTQQPNPN